MGVLVHDDGHARDEHEDRRNRYRTVVTVAHHHERLLLCRLPIFPLVLGNEDSHRCLPLLLKRQHGLDVQIPSVLVSVANKPTETRPAPPVCRSGFTQTLGLSVWVCLELGVGRSWSDGLVPLLFLLQYRQKWFLLRRHATLLTLSITTAFEVDQPPLPLETVGFARQ